MIDIKQEIQILLLRRGMSMSKLVRNLKKEGVLNTNIGSLSRMFTSKTIKFETVSLILDYLGCKIEISDNKKSQ
ncbi:MAG: hypothetical protein LUE64_01070 [Candidatus Gastranaerophilales bacterium]|nr:hypothetical protein [Candidatus Gastranaerophilales bacterium]